MDLLLVVFCISLLTLLAGTFAKWLENYSLTEPLVAMVVAVILSPYMLDLLHTGDEAQTHQIMITACKFTIAMALMSTALRITPKFFRSNPGSQSLIIAGGMLLMWVSTGVVLYVILDRPFAECLLIGAVVSPTDPVVAATIITGKTAEKYLPASIRNTLSFESGANDGLAFPIVAFSIMIFNQQEYNIAEWFGKSIMYETVCPVLIAVTAGFLAGRGLHLAHKAGFMTKTTLISYSVALSFFLLAGLDYIGMNGILGVFTGGIAFTSQLARNEDLMQEPVQESMERIFTIPIFFLFGLILPWPEWAALGMDAIWICAGVLFLRRIPSFIIMTPFVKQFRNRYRDMMLMGWFGPIGVAAIFYALYAREQTGMEDIWIFTSLIVFASTLVHGLTSVPLEKWYASKTD